MSEPQGQIHRQPLNSVSTKIIFFVFLSTFLTALVVSWISIESTHTYLRKQIDRTFPAMLERSRIDVERWLAGLQSELEALARGDALYDGEDTQAGRVAARGEDTQAGRVAARGSDSAAWASRLRGYVEANDAWWDLALLDAGGNVIASADLGGIPSREAWAPEVTSGPITIPADSPEELALMLFAPLPPDRPGAAYQLVGRVCPEALARLLERQARGGTGELVLTDAEGRSLAQDGEDPDDQLPARLRTSVTRLAEEGSGVVHEYTNAKGAHVLGALVHLEAAPLFLAVEAPFAQAFAPVLSVVTQVFISDLCIILLFSALAFKVTERMMHPIQALSEGARRISQGQTDHEIPEPGVNDELGLLTRAFNDMMRKLRRSHLEIEKAASRLRSQNEELHRANEVLSQLSITDGLTKLHNHRYFQDHLTREIKRRDRAGAPLSMLLVDLDDFKQLNDRYGHAAGDEILVRVAAIMSSSVRESDLLARYGGEEFVVLATNTDLTGAILLAEKIRMSVDDSVHIIDETMRPLRGITVSVGVAEYHGDRKEFFRSADRALYRAKAQGKNCVVTSEEPPAPPAVPFGDDI